MKQLWQSSKEYILYLFFGVLTTIVNYIVYFYCRSVWELHYAISNVISFLVAVLFAFFTNKYMVFGKNETNRLFYEFFSFLSLRLVSMGVETGFLFLGVEALHIDDGIMKILVSIITVLLNYGFSKWITFAGKE